jgi:hypothetical protein
VNHGPTFVACRQETIISLGSEPITGAIEVSIKMAQRKVKGGRNMSIFQDLLTQRWAILVKFPT